MWHPENTTETKAHHSETPEENKIDEKFAEDLEKNWESKTSSDVIM
jgi:hypothetical protein